ncbi:unnamed protein product [Macrosiphum euphorbiae]|uniref:Integrase catalytic domain-containing protein n=1 Tax=Macrosiphum euphorbiae TaxID=13131 RepID=A0AAV0W5M9_9HEMI|nr:unnamed protein product [Macrosiphum euphorbiae]
MRSITTGNTIVELREIFGRWGLPVTLVSDNGAQLTSHVFTTFLKMVCKRPDKTIKKYNGSQNKVFKEGDDVMIKSYKHWNKESWLKATIKRVLGTKRYECESNDNKTYIRHVDQMIDATIVETETRKQDSEKEVVSPTVRYDNNIKKRTRNMPSKLKDFIFN